MGHYDGPTRVKGTPYKGPEDKRMNFDEVELVLEKLKADVHQAVSDIVKDVVLPRQVSIDSIDIPVIHLTEIGSNVKTTIISKPQINVDLSI